MISSNSTNIALPIIHMSNFHIARFNMLVYIYSVRSVLLNIYLFMYFEVMRVSI